MTTTTETNVRTAADGAVTMAALGEMPTRPGAHLVHCNFKDWVAPHSRTPVEGYVQLAVFNDGSSRIHGYPTIRRSDRWGVDAPDTTRRRVFEFLQSTVAELVESGDDWLTAGEYHKRSTDRQMLGRRAADALKLYQAIRAEVHKLDLGQPYDATVGERQ